MISVDTCGYHAICWEWFRLQQVTAVVEETTRNSHGKRENSHESFRWLMGVSNIHISQTSMAIQHTEKKKHHFQCPWKWQWTKRDIIFHSPFSPFITSAFLSFFTLGSPNALPHPWIWHVKFIALNMSCWLSSNYVKTQWQPPHWRFSHHSLLCDGPKIELPWQHNTSEHMAV